MRSKIWERVAQSPTPLTIFDSECVFFTLVREELWDVNEKKKIFQRREPLCDSGPSGYGYAGAYSHP